MKINSMGIAYQIRDQKALYFLTFQVVGWVDVFSRQSYRDIVIESLKYCQIQKSLKIFAYVIMTNHVHAILQSPSGKLSDIIRDFKKYVSKRILREIDSSSIESRRKWLKIIFKYHAKYNKRVGSRQLWTHENHAVELSTNRMIDNTLHYIHQNPVKAGWVMKEQDYIYSSASYYYGEGGLIEVEILR